MNLSVLSKFDPPFLIDEPARQTAPFVFNVPHAGSVYPEAFLASSRLDASMLRRSEDAFVDALLARVPSLGAPLMSARFPRAYLDLNREPYELDPRMFEGRLPPFANTRSMRVAGGLGTLPRIVGNGQDIYRDKLSVPEAMQRIEGLYKPYHRLLRSLMTRTAKTFGHAILIDCHSMPSSGFSSEDEVKADIVLGDRYGTSCAPLLTDLVDSAFRRRGYRTIRNKPYAGGYITEHYGEPAASRHSLQIEINRSLYMDEQRYVRSDGFVIVAADLTAIFIDVIAALSGGITIPAVAAE